MSEDFLELPVAFMNADHAEFVQALAELEQLLESGDTAAVGPAFERLLEHTREHFGREEAAMEQIQFPPYRAHKGEHERVLGVMEQILAQWQAAPDSERMQGYIEDMRGWFHQHLDTMDRVTSVWLARNGIE
ncbi:MAG: hemerythrin [Gammaproteobacteria bacterium]|nr:MAG: hemerythrin [Gammaproteobacteria bacterium]